MKFKKKCTFLNSHTNDHSRTSVLNEVQMAISRTSVLDLVLELVQELQMAGSRTSVLELVLELVQELQMAGSRTSSRTTNGQF